MYTLWYTLGGEVYPGIYHPMYYPGIYHPVYHPIHPGYTTMLPRGQVYPYLLTSVSCCRTTRPWAQRGNISWAGGSREG